jgi:uncharacterized protein (TIGR00730 family)
LGPAESRLPTASRAAAGTSADVLRGDRWRGTQASVKETSSMKDAPEEASDRSTQGERSTKGTASASRSGDLVTLSDEKRAVEILAQSVLGLWEVVNNLTRLRPTRREEFRVTIFGSARIPADHWVYGAVRELAAEFARMGCVVVTGGGPGLMQAANEGAASAGADRPEGSVGIRIHLPFEQESNPFVGQVFEHGTFFSRLHHFVLVSDAFVVVPGGIGTVLELMLVWQLLQVRNLHHTPLILVGRMWHELVEWARTYLSNAEFPLASAADIAIPTCVNTPEEAIALVRKRHEEWAADGSARMRAEHEFGSDR